MTTTGRGRTSPRVVVLGAGYAGTAAVTALRDHRRQPTVTWISREPYHFVLHEAHRIVSDPDTVGDLTVPIERIAGRDIQFRQSEVTGVATNERVVRLSDGTMVPYDLLVIALGSETAFYGLPGIAENALSLKSRQDALDIHHTVMTASGSASTETPATVVIGGAGLSGIQVAGELADLRDRTDRPLRIRIVEAMDRALPMESAVLSAEVTRLLEDRDIELITGHPVTGASEAVVALEDHDPVPYDVFIWTGGVAGRALLADGGLAMEHGRVKTDAYLRTSDEAVFAIGDAAVVDADDHPVPPTAQAAWQAGEAAAENVIRTIDGRTLKPFAYRDRGTLLSVGQAAVGHDVPGFPGRTIHGPPAAALKKLVAARWIATVTNWCRGLRALPSL